jgi:hypothetical protein
VLVDVEGDVNLCDDAALAAAHERGRELVDALERAGVDYRNRIIEQRWHVLVSDTRAAREVLDLFS